MENIPKTRKQLWESFARDHERIRNEQDKTMLEIIRLEQLIKESSARGNNVDRLVRERDYAAEKLLLMESRAALIVQTFGNMRSERSMDRQLKAASRQNELLAQQLELALAQGKTAQAQTEVAHQQTQIARRNLNWNRAYVLFTFVIMIATIVSLFRR